MGGRGLSIGRPGAGFSTRRAVPPPPDLILAVLLMPGRVPFLANASSIVTARAIPTTSIGRTRVVMAKHLSIITNCPLACSQARRGLSKNADLARNEVRPDRSATLKGARRAIGGREKSSDPLTAAPDIRIRLPAASKSRQPV